MTTTHTPGVYCKQGVLGAWCHSCKSLLMTAPQMLKALKGCLFIAQAWAEQTKEEGHGELTDDAEHGAALQEVERLKEIIDKAEGRL